MPEPKPSSPNEGEVPNSVNTPPPALDGDPEPDADSTHDNLVTVRTDESFILPPNLATSSNNGESTNETEKIPSRFQLKDSETDDRNRNLAFGSPTLLQEDIFKFTRDTSELASDNKTEDEYEDENEHVTHASLLANSSDSTANPNMTQDDEEKDEHGDAEAGDKDPQANEEVQEINSFILPDTVTELTAENGVKVYIVGTAHFSKESQQDVIQTIQRVQPSTVVLELCDLRGNFLDMDEEAIHRDADKLTCENILAAFRLFGISGVLHVILDSVSASCTKQLGTAPGGEFRVAHREANKIPGCDVVFGDRWINITISRAWSSLSIMQILGLAWSLPSILFKKVEITKEEVEACKEKDVLGKSLSSISEKYPNIMRVLVDERDMFMSYLIRLTAESYDPRCRYRQGEMKRPVVCIVGLAHVPGIVKYWGKVTHEEFEELNRITDPTLTSIVIGKTVKFSFYVLLGFGAYKCSKKLFNFPSDQLIQSAVDRVLPPIQKISDRLWPTKN